ATLDALSLGANDYVAKPSGESRLETSIAVLREELIPKIRQFFFGGEKRRDPEPPPAPLPGALKPAVRRKSNARRSVVAIGVSTGGPTALSSIVPAFPGDFPAPILIVQHMPPVFTHLLAERLQKGTELRVQEAAQGMAVVPGNIFIAPGNYHMCIRRF